VTSKNLRINNERELIHSNEKTMIKSGESTWGLK
jgi:hypothetical protein